MNPRSRQLGKAAMFELLPSMTQTVFEQCAPMYIREDKHWGCDLDVIKQCVERFDPVDIVDLGVGHAWHLANLFLISSANIRQAVGIDYSEAMLAQARSLLGAISVAGVPLNERVDLRHADITETHLATASFDVGLLLNNTLGNLPGISFRDAKIQRKRLLSMLNRALRPKGCIVISVNNADCLAEEDKYGDVFEIDPVLSDLETMDLVVRFQGEDALYYSHWFTQSELERLMVETGYRVDKLEKRASRIVLVGHKARGDG